MIPQCALVIPAQAGIQVAENWTPAVEAVSQLKDMHMMLNCHSGLTEFILHDDAGESSSV